LERGEVNSGQSANAQLINGETQDMQERERHVREGEYRRTVEEIPVRAVKLDEVEPDGLAPLNGIKERLLEILNVLGGGSDNIRIVALVV
jgi:hypothetical protein